MAAGHGGEFGDGPLHQLAYVAADEDDVGHPRPVDHVRPMEIASRLCTRITIRADAGACSVTHSAALSHQSTKIVSAQLNRSLSALAAPETPGPLRRRAGP